MKKIVTFCLAFLFVGVCSLMAGGSQAQEENTIKIGSVLPISGGSALVGGYQLDGYKMVLNHFNKSGGVLGKQVELVLADSTGVPDTGVSEFERLANDPSICAFIGTYNSGVAAAIAPLAIKYKMPFVVTNAVADSILSENSHYIFRGNNGDFDSIIHYNNLFKFLGEIRGKAITRIACVFENSDWGKGTSASIAQSAKESKIELVLNESFQNESADLSSLVNKVKQLNPDFVIPVMYLNDALLFTRQMMEYDCNVPIIAHGGGFLDIDYPAKAGKFSEYVMSASGWFPDVIDVVKTKEAKDIQTAYIKSSGHDMNEMVANGWLGMYILLDAIQRAGKTDREAIALALDATDLKSDHPALMFHPYQGVKFGDYPGIRYNQNIYANFSWAQMVGGTFKLIYPPDMIPGKNPIVFPPPAWNKR
jgi:branched-chain amino acid transport system substrate-binding protein